MSYIHKVLNVLLRGLVIYAVLGSECTHSDDLPSHTSDAASVAATGKPGPCRATLQVSLIHLRMYSDAHLSPFSSLSPVAFSGKSEECPAQGASWKVWHLV